MTKEQVEEQKIIEEQEPESAIDDVVEAVDEKTDDVVVEDKKKKPKAKKEANKSEAPVAEDDEEEEEEEIDRSKGDWYIIQTGSNVEYKVKKGIEQRIKALGLENQIFEILIPEEEVVEVRNNKKYERTKKMYPGYLFIRMEFDVDIWYIVKRVPGIAKIMGRQQEPSPVTDAEMLKVLRQVGVKVQRYQIDFEVGDMIKIITGPFRGYTGPVKEINMEKGKCKSLLLIFGRETSVEIDFDQVEKVSK